MSFIHDPFLSAVGHTVKKSAGHLAHDVKHGIEAVGRVEHRRNVEMHAQLKYPGHSAKTHRQRERYERTH